MSFILAFFARIPVLVLTGVTAVGLLGSSVLSVQAYTQAQSSSQVAYEQAASQIRARIDASVKQQAALELAISNAKALLDSSNGKTLDETTRAALNAAIADAQRALEQAAAQVVLAQSQLNADAAEQQGFVLPWQVSAAASELDAAPISADTELAQVVSGVGAKMKAVNEAQAAWQAEQDRIAAEAARAAAAAAARAAAARAAAAAKTLAESGGNTTSTSPAAPTTTQAAAPVSPNFSAENYIAAIAPNSYVVWVANMCANQYPGQNVYLCGYATVNLNGNNTDRVPITLDSTLADRYSNSVGVSVLVHEAAHARQWFKYGRTIETAWTTSTGLTGRSAVEYMADCATIVKLGYGTGTYIPRGQTCSARDQTEAATFWR